MPPRFSHNPKVTDQYRIPRPRSLKEVPSFIRKVLSSFTNRLIYIYKLVWEAKPSVLFVMMAMSLLNGVLPVLGAYIGKEILNSLAMAYSESSNSTRNIAFNVIMFWLIFQFAFMFFNNITSRIYGMITRISGEIVSNHIKVKILKKAKEIDISRFDSPDFYAKMENANREAGHRPIEILSSGFSVISSVISIVSFITVLWFISPIAPLIVIVVSIPSTIINFIFRKKHVNYMFFRSKDRRQMNYYSNVIVNKDLVKEIRIFNLSDTFCDKYQSVFTRYFGGLKKLIYSEYKWTIAAAMVTIIANCVLFIYIARGVYDGNYEVGNFSLYTSALTSISSGVASIISTTASIYEGTLFINNMIAFMNEESLIVPISDPPRSVQKHIGHNIQFEHVCFKYPGCDKYVLNDINLTINEGSTVVLVGLNGAGKTTLIKLLTRLYDPTEGRVLLDGHDIREYDLTQLYDLFGIIFQDFGRYAVTVKENIAFGQVNKDVSDESICEAAKKSNASDFINKLPDGYDTPLMRFFEDDATELSTGQWQKLAIARAFYSDSDILILDEPTASLDPMAEQEIFNQFDTLRKDKTTLFVSHRLSSATIADMIIVMEDGKIIETGNHSELMKAHGKYCELFTVQASRYNLKD